MSKIKLVCIDLDSVIVPFKREVCQKLNIPYDVDNIPSDDSIYDLTGGKKAFWDIFGTHDWFANLPLYPWSKKLVNTVDKSGVDWIFLTKSSMNHGVASGKCKWIDKNFKKFKNKLWINRGSKSYMAASGRMLIDDKAEPNGNEWVAKGGLFYHWSELHPLQVDEAKKRIKEIRKILTDGA